MGSTRCWEFGASGRHDQGLLHGRHIRTAELGLHLVQLIRLLGLVVGLNQQLHSERIVLVFFEMSDRVLVFLLIHQQRSRGSLIGTLDDAVAAAIRQLFEFFQRFLAPATDCPDVQRAPTRTRRMRESLFVTVGGRNARADG